MSEEKHFEATRSRLEKAKRDGDVARSQDLCAVFAFAAGTAAVAAIAPSLGAAFRLGIVVASRGENPAGLAQFVAMLVLIPVAAAGAASAGCAAFQGGPILHWPRLKFERLSPIENGKRILSRETLFTALRSLLAFVCAAAAVIPALQ